MERDVGCAGLRVGAGVPLWTNRYNGPGNDQDYAFNVGVDSINNLIVNGYSIGSSGDYDPGCY